MATKRPVAVEVRAMTRREVIQRAIEKAITWQQAADICGMTARHMSRLRERYERLGIDRVRDGRTGKRQPRQIPVERELELCRLKREVYADFWPMVQHSRELARVRVGLAGETTRLFELSVR
jgi:hypothetical protein